MKSTHALAAKAIRKELKQKYPNTKFSVRSESFAGGNAVRVEWTEGEQTQEIDAIVGKYQYGSFDGMTDSYNYTNRIEEIPQVKWVTTDRKIRPQTVAKSIDKINENFGLNINYEIKKYSFGDGDFIVIEDDWLDNHNSYSNQFVYRQMREMGV